jgi:outer membrane protein OmpA-like peptidoglycan-associated protein
MAETNVMASEISSYIPGLPERKLPNWALRALIISLLIHAGLYFAFKQTRLPYLKEAPAERLVPRQFFTGGRVDLPESVFDQPEAKPTPEKKAPSALVPNETEQFEPLATDVVISPTAPDLSKAIAPDRPQATSTDLNNIARLQQSSAGSLAEETKGIQEQLLSPTERGTSAPKLNLTERATAGSGKPGTGTDDNSIPGLADIDDLLGRSGPVATGTRLGMKGGALFEYDSADLRNDAQGSLTILGEALLRSPQATLSIEGHTDSFGTAEYNQMLSLRRAEAVKAWLVQVMGIDPARIETKGFGSTKLLAPATASVDEQQINRRVEIVFKARR